MTAPTCEPDTGAALPELHGPLGDLVAQAPGLRAAAVVSGDGVPLLSCGQSGTPAADLAAVVAGLAGLTRSAATLTDAGRVRHTLITMATGSLVVMAIDDGVLLAAHTTPEVDLALVAYHMARFTTRAAHVLPRAS